MPILLTSNAKMCVAIRSCQPFNIWFSHFVFILLDSDHMFLLRSSHINSREFYLLKANLEKCLQKYNGIVWHFSNGYEKVPNKRQWQSCVAEGREEWILIQENLGPTPRIFTIPRLFLRSSQNRITHLKWKKQLTASNSGMKLKIRKFNSPWLCGLSR